MFIFYCFTSSCFILKGRKNMTCSFLIATYNRKNELKKSIDSVISIAEDGDEIIINDDGSDQDTIDMLKSYAESNPLIKLYLHENFAGIYKNMHYGFQKCTKDVVIVCDSDDIMLDNRRSEICDYFEKHQNIDVIYHNAVIINENDTVVNDDFFKAFNQKNSFIRIFSKASFYGAMMCFRNSFIKKYYEYIVKTGLCWDITLGVIGYKLKKLVFLDKKLIQYRRWQNNISVKKKRKITEKIKNRLKQLNFYFKFKPKKEKPE